jgi:hypothetical protein
VKLARGSILVFGAIGLASASLTVLFLAMRSVMDIGGSCASGGAFQIAHPCPGHVAALMPAAIWGGLIFVGLYVFFAMHYSVPSLVSLAWPALFISLGYNFLDYAIHGQAGLFIVGVVFVLMGGVPLLWALPHLWRVYVLGRADDPKPWHVTTTGAMVGTTMDAMKMFSRLGQTPNEDMTESLQRLDDLHKSGALDDLEYAKAKDRVIRGDQTT